LLAVHAAMPLYEYLCDACGARFELIRKFSDPPLEACPTCGGGPVQKLVSSPAFQFKGSGWYITDYARKSTGEGESAGEKKPAGSPAEATPVAADATAKAKEGSAADKPGAAAKPAATTTSTKDP